MARHADELMSQALSDPRAALANGRRILSHLEASAHLERSEVLRAMSMAARHLEEIEMSIELASEAADAAEAVGDLDRRLMALLTMSGSLAIAGRTEEALQTIDVGLRTAEEPHLRSRFIFQRGAVLHNAGNLGEALTAYEEALPIQRLSGDTFSVGLTLNRLGQLFTAQGRYREAQDRLEESLDLALEANERASAHGIMHNVGLLEAYRGNIPEALDWLQRSDDLFMEVTGADAPQHVARSEVLISAGLFQEALEAAVPVAMAAGASHYVEHQADALLVSSRAALLAGRFSEAAHFSDEAVAIYERVASAPRQAEARALSVQARFERDGGSDALLSEAEGAIDLLASEGLVMAEFQARSVAARIADSLGMRDKARSQLRDVATVDKGPVEMRLEGVVARARLAELDDAVGKAARAAAAGLRMIDDYQATLAASDLRMGIERHGVELAEIGLRHALESRRPRRVLRWLDRTRARAMRVRPATPPVSDDVSESLADLRRIVAELRQPENHDDPGLTRRRLQLERTIARAERVRRQDSVEQGDVPVDELIDSLEDIALYEMGVVDGRLIAVVVRAGRSKMVELGDVARLSGELTHLRFAMRRAARRGRPLDTRVFDPLSAALFGELHLGDGPVLVVPPPSLMSVPWAAIPALRGRKLVVAPSAQMWWRARRTGEERSGVVIAGGPDLEVAEEEVRRVGQVQSDAVILLPGVGVEEVKAEMEGAVIAHIACHATFSVENPMFSSLRLGDGDLNVYDIERLHAPPSLVVLSACDSGYTETRAGDELAGLTSALLSMGTRSVVASVGLVPDSPATSDLMVDFHKGLVAGLEPAAALASAQEKAFEDPERFVSAASFICVGA